MMPTMALPVGLTFEVHVTIARGDFMTQCKFKVYISVHVILSNFLYCGTCIKLML